MSEIGYRPPPFDTHLGIIGGRSAAPGNVLHWRRIAETGVSSALIASDLWAQRLYRGRLSLDFRLVAIELVACQPPNHPALPHGELARLVLGRFLRSALPIADLLLDRFGLLLGNAV